MLVRTAGKAAQDAARFPGGMTSATALGRLAERREVEESLRLPPLRIGWSLDSDERVECHVPGQLVSVTRACIEEGVAAGVCWPPLIGRTVQHVSWHGLDGEARQQTGPPLHPLRCRRALPIQAAPGHGTRRVRHYREPHQYGVAGGRSSPPPRAFRRSRPRRRGNVLTLRGIAPRVGGLALGSDQHGGRAPQAPPTLGAAAAEPWRPRSPGARDRCSGMAKYAARIRVLSRASRSGTGFTSTVKRSGPRLDTIAPR